MPQVQRFKCQCPAIAEACFVSSLETLFDRQIPDNLIIPEQEWYSCKTLTYCADYMTLDSLCILTQKIRIFIYVTSSERFGLQYSLTNRVDPDQAAPVGAA